MDEQKLFADLIGINKRMGDFIKATEGRNRQMTLAALKSLTHQMDCAIFRAQKRDAVSGEAVR